MAKAVMNEVGGILFSPPPQIPPPPLGASGQQLVGGVVGVQNRGVAAPRAACAVFQPRELKNGNFQK